MIIRKSAGNVRFPDAVYHLTYEENWPSIQEHGLLSTAGLLALAGVEQGEQERILSTQRTEQIKLPNGVVLRDQSPMPPDTLVRCLHQMTPGQWYSLVNTKVFFWLDYERLQRLARANQAYPQIILRVDTSSLLKAYAQQITLSPINTGNARRRPAKRGPHTFVSYTQWLTTGWTSEAKALGTRERPRSHKPAELTVNQSIPDIMNFVTAVRHLKPGELLSDDENYFL